MGLCNLPYLEKLLERRKQIYQRHQEKLEGVPLQFQQIAADTQYNHACCLLLLEAEPT